MLETFLWIGIYEYYDFFLTFFNYTAKSIQRVSLYRFFRAFYAKWIISLSIILLLLSLSRGTARLEIPTRLWHLFIAPIFQKIFNYPKVTGLAQYIARCPISLDKITYEDFHGRILFMTPKYNDYFKENFRVFDVMEFIALVTAHIPPKHKQLIRRYGLYASRTRDWSEA